MYKYNIPKGLSDIDRREEDLTEAIDFFLSNSATGPDGFPAMRLKQYRLSLARYDVLEEG